MNTHFVTAAGNFAIHFAASLALLAAFARGYTLMTPYNEWDDIRSGKMAPAVSLSGALVGFAIPLLAALYVGAGIFDFGLWAVFVGCVQLGCFWVLYQIFPKQIENNNVAAALVFAAVSVSVGALNALCLIP